MVLDASAAIELVVGTTTGARVEERIEADGEVHAPHLLDVEVVQVLRSLTRRGKVDTDRATAALRNLRDLGIVRHPHEPLIRRVWQLRENLTAYDASYVALAEALEAPLLTRDARIARAPGVEAEIEVL